MIASKSLIFEIYRRKMKICFCLAGSCHAQKSICISVRQITGAPGRNSPDNRSGR